MSSDIYTVQDDSRIVLSVAVGPGQPAGIAVRLSGVERTGGMVIENLDLGVGADLRGERLLVDAVVANDNPQTDRVGATLVLEGGEAVRDWVERAELDSGEVGRFSFTITFV